MRQTKTQRKTEARASLLSGVKELADMAGMTLGAASRLVAIAKTNPSTGEVYERGVVDDGVTVARSLNPKDEFMNMGLSIVREAAQKQVDEVGDGTTVTILLANAIIQEAEKRIAAGVHPQEVKKEVLSHLQIALKCSEKYAKPLDKGLSSMDIALASSKEQETAKIIADVFEKMGVDGVINIEESRSEKTYVEYETGMRFETGYASPYFATNPETMLAYAKDLPILVTNHNLTDLQVVHGMFNGLHSSGVKSCVILAPSYSEAVLSFLVQNKMEGKLLTIAIKAPSYGEDQNGVLFDLAIMTGSTFIDHQAGFTLASVKSSHLGRVDSIQSGRDATIIRVADKAKDDVAGRIKVLKHQRELRGSEFEKKRIDERIARLGNGIAVIKVGGQTQVEMLERVERVDDAVNAVRVALRHGVVAGGETIYLRIRPNLPDGVLKNAFLVPFQVLLDNAGISIAEYDMSINNIPEDHGIDVTTAEVVDLYKAGIIDPYEVIVQAMKNAVSVATQIIVAEGIIVPDEMPLVRKK